MHLHHEIREISRFLSLKGESGKNFIRDFRLQIFTKVRWNNLAHKKDGKLPFTWIKTSGQDASIDVESVEKYEKMTEYWLRRWMGRRRARGRSGPGKFFLERNSSEHTKFEVKVE